MRLKCDDCGKSVSSLLCSDCRNVVIRAAILCPECYELIVKEGVEQ